MKKVLPILLVVLTVAVNGQQNLIINTGGRAYTTLNGTWKMIVDPLETGYYDYRYQPLDQREEPGNDAFFSDAKPVNRWDRIEYDFDKGESLLVPGDWNSQQEKLMYYEGTIWYRRTFDVGDLEESNRYFIWFGAANYRADVYLNGKKLGVHIGGFTPFNFEVTGLLEKEGNSLVVKVDNKRSTDAVPTINFDWWNYGGLTRDVKLLVTPATFIEDYLVQLDREEPAYIRGYVKLNGTDMAGRQTVISIPKLGISEKAMTGSDGKATFRIKAKKIQKWSPEDPVCYDVFIQNGSEKVEDRIGFRTIATDGDRILLNGEEIFLKGICIHAENPLKTGRATSPEDAALLLGWAKELGCNFVRLAHYPHAEHMVKMAEQMGIMVWEENPVYWTIDWDNPGTYKNAENQLTEVIQRDKNRAAVIIWSMANETPLSGARLAFLTRLAAKARSLDDSRLISAALEKHYVEGKENVLTIDDPFAEYLDVLSFNEYVGWYDGLPSKCEKIRWDITQDKPVIISEFGGGALQGYHGDSLTRWTEEFQEYLYEESVQMLDRIPQLAGMTPWILVDFRSPKRTLPEIQDGWNRKGLISNNGQKKKAFRVMQKYYEGK